MNKLKSLEELQQIQQEAIQAAGIRFTGEDPDRTVIAVSMATCGIAAGAKDTAQALLGEVLKHQLSHVSVIAIDCMGFCLSEPLVEIREPGKAPVRYGSVDALKACSIIENHIIKGIVLEQEVLSFE